MAPILKVFVATVTTENGTQRYHFRQPPNNYAGTIDTITGITEGTDDDQNEPAVNVGELLNSGKVHRVVVQYNVAGVRRSAKILVAKGKLDTALDDLIGATFRGGQITSARIPAKATYF